MGALVSSSRTVSYVVCLLMLGAVSAPAGAEALVTRLNAGSLVSTPPRSGTEWYQWGTGPKSRSSGDMVVGDTKTRSPLSLVVLGAGAAAGGVGVVFGLRNRSANSDYNTATTAASRASARDRAATAATVANVSFVACGVLLAAGLGILFFTDL